MTDQPPQQGWHPDPWSQASYRWWDGTQWTEHTHTAQVPPPPAGSMQSQTAPGPQVYYVRQPHQPSSALGVVALVCGLAGIAVAIGPAIFAIFGLALGLTAFVVGIVSAAKGAGRGMGIAGLVLGLLACAIAVVSISVMQSGLRDVQRDLDSILEDFDDAFSADNHYRLDVKALPSA